MPCNPTSMAPYGRPFTECLPAPATTLRMTQTIKSDANGWDAALPEEGRKIVEECLGRILPQNWRIRRDVIETAIASATEPKGPDMQAFIAGAVVAAIIERLDAPAIVSADQAQLFAMSANTDHQLAACDWFISQCSAETLPALPAEPIRLH